MESSSDNSFAWTDASADAKDSDAMAIEDVKSNYNGEESDSGNGYKSKLHKELFENNEKQKSHLDETPQKKKKKKIKEEISYDKELESPKKKRIKTESESDTDVKKKKRKKSRHYDTEGGTPNDSQYSIALDISHPNENVKQEQVSFETVTTTNSTNTDSYNQCNFESVSVTKKKKSKKNKSSDHIQQSLQSVQGDNEDNNKNSHETSDITNISDDMSKKEHIKSIEDINVDCKGMIVEDMFSAEETVVEQPQKKKKKHKSEIYARRNKSSEEDELNNSNTYKNTKNKQSAPYSSKDFVREDDSYDEGIETQSDDHKKIKNNTTSTLVHNSFINGHSRDNDSDSGVQHEINSTNVSTNQQHNTTSKIISRISDRITFEDEIDSELKTQHHSDYEKYIHLHFKQFLEQNINLKPISTFSKKTLIAQDDELWILKFPPEIDIQSLKGVDLTLGTKGKIKCNDQTYDGTVDLDTKKIDLVSYENYKFQVNSIPLNGTVRFNKKMRKEHFFNDNIMVNNQTNFISLLETKTHHPLFGFNYKKAIKIPSSIAEHLKAADQEAESSPLRNEKKKRKKQKQNVSVDLEQMDLEKLESTVKSEPEVVEKKKKKRKRKHSEEDDTSFKKAKRIKQDPDCVETWESEKAIEENLFNF